MAALYGKDIRGVAARGGFIISYHGSEARTYKKRGLQRCKEAPHNTACSPPQAKRTSTTRRITGRIRISSDSPMQVPGAKKFVMGEKTRAKHESWQPRVALQVYSR